MQNLNVNLTLIANLTRNVHKVIVFQHVHLWAVDWMLFACPKTTGVYVNASLDTLVIHPLHATKVCFAYITLFFIQTQFSTNCILVEPVTLPPVVSGCLSNNDCPDYTACQSRKCINPCAAPNVCAPNANCRVTRHQAVCTCPDGYIGSPEISCSLRKLKSELYKMIRYRFGYWVIY